MTRGAAGRIEEVAAGKAAICREILADLPEWFGIPQVVEAYVEAADALPMQACLAPDGTALGFVSVKAHTAFAVEVYVMAVRRAWHRRGIGRALLDTVAQSAALRGARFLTVKTLSPSRVDPHYAATRTFYEAMGFTPVVEFPTLWGENNPCLLMIKGLLPANS